MLLRWSTKNSIQVSEPLLKMAIFGNCFIDNGQVLLKTPKLTNVVTLYFSIRGSLSQAWSRKTVIFTLNLNPGHVSRRIPMYVGKKWGIIISYKKLHKTPDVQVPEGKISTLDRLITLSPKQLNTLADFKTCLSLNIGSET